VGRVAVAFKRVSSRLLRIGSKARSLAFEKLDLLPQCVLITWQMTADLQRGSPEDAFALAREYPPERMCIVQEGFEKKDLLRAAA
jgi:hypothetical protein